MTPIPLAIVGVMYLWVAVALGRAGDWWSVMIWTGYAFAQVGFIGKYWST